MARLTMGLLRGRELGGLEDAAVHLADERHGVGDALVPAGVAPRALAGLAPRLQVLVAWNNPTILMCQECMNYS